MDAPRICVLTRTIPRQRRLVGPHSTSSRKRRRRDGRNHGYTVDPPAGNDARNTGEEVSGRGAASREKMQRTAPQEHRALQSGRNKRRGKARLLGHTGGQE